MEPTAKSGKWKNGNRDDETVRVGSEKVSKEIRDNEHAAAGDEPSAQDVFIRYPDKHENVE